jgi:hypothetical protein
MVDIWSRAGKLAQAQNFISTLSHPSMSVWKAFLGACLSYGDVQRAQFASSQIRKLDPRDSAAYVHPLPYPPTTLEDFFRGVIATVTRYEHIYFRFNILMFGF